MLAEARGLLTVFCLGVATAAGMTFGAGGLSLGAGALAVIVLDPIGEAEDRVLSIGDASLFFTFANVAEQDGVDNFGSGSFITSTLFGSWGARDFFAWGCCEPGASNGFFTWSPVVLDGGAAVAAPPCDFTTSPPTGFENTDRDALILIPTPSRGEILLSFFL